MAVGVKKAHGRYECVYLACKVAVSGIVHWWCNHEGPLGLISRSHNDLLPWRRSTDSNAVFAWATELFSPCPEARGSVLVNLESKYPLFNKHHQDSILVVGEVRIDLTPYYGRYIRGTPYCGSHTIQYDYHRVRFNQSFVRFGRGAIAHTTRCYGADLFNPMFGELVSEMVDDFGPATALPCTGFDFISLA